MRCLQVAVAAANFERRVAGTAAACGVFDKLLAQHVASKDKAGSGSQSSNTSAGNSVGAVYVLYANFLNQVGLNAAAVLCISLSMPSAMLGFRS